MPSAGNQGNGGRETSTLGRAESLSHGYDGVKLLESLGLGRSDHHPKEMLPHHGEPDGDLYDTGLKVVIPR